MLSTIQKTPVMKSGCYMKIMPTKSFLRNPHTSLTILRIFAPPIACSTLIRVFESQCQKRARILVDFIVFHTLITYFLRVYAHEYNYLRKFNVYSKLEIKDLIYLDVPRFQSATV